MSGDNANTLKDTDSKGGREEKEAAGGTTTETTFLATFETNEYEIATTTESFWKEDELANEADTGLHQQANIRNTSDARGIFSNMVKTINRCKFTSNFFYNGINDDTMKTREGKPSTLHNKNIIRRNRK